MPNAVDYTIPVWHPLVVHVPITALLLAGIAALVWAYSADGRWGFAATFLAVVGAIGSAAAWLTGDPMKQQSEGVPIVETLVDAHERLATLTLVGSILAAVAWLAVLTSGYAHGSAATGLPDSSSALPHPEGPGASGQARSITQRTAPVVGKRSGLDQASATVRWVLAAIAVVLAGLVLRTGHLGGLMVWGTPAG